MDPSTPQSPNHHHNHSSLPPLKPSPTPTLSNPHPNRSIHPPTLQKTINHLLTPLNPLISVSTGQTHPSFPPNLLSYRLLTSSQLDDLARHYHQVYPPVQETAWYPVTIPPWIGVDGDGKGVDLATKRRRFGRFIGLRGCETPIDDREREGGECLDGLGDLAPREEQLLVWIEREWQAALMKARAEGEMGTLGLVRKCGGC